MLARIRKAQDNESGFTLIELLVVIIIIGILAAIAIPTFLKQREKGYISAMKSDLKNASTAQESYATDNNGSYTFVEANLATEGYNASPDVVVLVSGVVGNPASFELCATHAKVANKTFRYSSTTGAITAGTAACAEDNTP
jgi:type IV pilus assembly protein PilA